MSSSQVTELVKKGFFIGAHSYEHPLFRKLSPQQQLHEVISSIADMKERFSVPYSFFAFPFDDIGISDEVLQKLYANRKIALNASFGTSGLKKPEKYSHYQRIPIEKGGGDAAGYIRKEYYRYLIKEILGKNRIKR